MSIAAPSRVHVGEHFDITLTVVNHGPDMSGGFVLAFHFDSDAGMRLESAPSTCTAVDPGSFTCDIADDLPAAGESRARTFRMVIAEDRLTTQDTAASLVRFAPDPDDPNHANDSAVHPIHLSALGGGAPSSGTTDPSAGFAPLAGTGPEVGGVVAIGSAAVVLGGLLLGGKRRRSRR